MFLASSKAISLTRTILLMLGITTGLLLAIEIALSILFYYRDIGANGPISDDRINADTYQQADWTSDYYREFKESNNSQWRPYTYWRRKPYQGQYINIDSQGIRKTWQADIPAVNANKVKPTIFLFGGSTMWGTGARDEFTIPSNLAKQLAKNNIYADIVNFGESGYVNTQEMISLVRELQKGHVPDVVIFYDGVNDIYSAYQQKLAGIPQNEFNRVLEFSQTNNANTTNSWQAAVKHLATARLARAISRRLNLNSFFTNHAGFFSSPKQAEQIQVDNLALANNVLNIYEENINIIQSLAKRYQFNTLFYWQPTIFNKSKLTQYEETKKQEFDQIRTFVSLTDQLFNQRFSDPGKLPVLRDISKIFLNETEPRFVDWCHLGEVGNKEVANRLLLDLMPLLDRSKVDKR